MTNVTLVNDSVIKIRLPEEFAKAALTFQAYNTTAGPFSAETDEDGMYTAVTFGPDTTWKIA